MQNSAGVTKLLGNLLVTLQKVAGASKAADAKACDWEESKHKRAANGQFGSGGSSKASGSKGNPAPTTNAQKWEKMDAINKKIKEASKAVHEAEFAGVRGQQMIDLKMKVKGLQAEHKKIRATLS